MKATDMLEKITTLLNAKVQLAEAKLENGTILEAESFAQGEAVFIKTEDDKVALPVGEYTLEDGKILVVVEEGIISEIKESEAVEEEAPAVEEEMSEVSKEELEEIEVEAPIEELPQEEAQKVEDVIQAVVEAIAPEIATINEEMGKMKEELEALKKDKEKLSSQAPAQKPFKHNPEANVKSAPKRSFASNRPATTMDTVYSKLFNK